MAKRKNDLRLYADELGKGLLGELDYNLEARNATEFMVGTSFYLQYLTLLLELCLRRALKNIFRILAVLFNASLHLTALMHLYITYPSPSVFCHYSFFLFLSHWSFFKIFYFIF